MTGHGIVRRHVAALLCLAAAACSPAQPEVPAAAERDVAAPAAGGGGAPSGEVRVEGRVTGEGVECPALRSGETLYTLAGAPGWVTAGDSVRVEGTIAEISICQQGTTISVRSVTRVP